MNLFKALFGSSFFQQEMKRNQQYRDNYACCDDIDVNIDFAEEIEDEIQNEKLFLSDYIPESYLYAKYIYICTVIISNYMTLHFIR